MSGNELKDSGLITECKHCVSGNEMVELWNLKAGKITWKEIDEKDLRSLYLNKEYAVVCSKYRRLET